MNKETSCGAVCFYENKVLMIHSVYGHWGFPKGHVEKDETYKQTAIREVKEETNIDIIINNKYRYTTSYSPKENVMKEVVYFLAQNIDEDKKPQLEEVSEVKWFTLEEAMNTITYENSKEILNKLKKDIEEEK